GGGGFDGGPQPGAAGADHHHVEVVGLVLGHLEEPQVPDGAVGDEADVEVGGGDPDQTDPGDEHVPLVEPGHELPQPVPGRFLGETVQPTTADVAAGVAGQHVGAEQDGVDQEDDGADAHTEPVGEVEGPQGVPQ